MSSPFFKDPRAQARSQPGIVHRPGMAKRMLDELLPGNAAEPALLHPCLGELARLNLISLAPDGAIGLPEASRTITARAMILAMSILGPVDPDDA